MGHSSVPRAVFCRAVYQRRRYCRSILTLGSLMIAVLALSYFYYQRRRYCRSILTLGSLISTTFWRLW